MKKMFCLVGLTTLVACHGASSQRQKHTFTFALSEEGLHALAMQSGLSSASSVTPLALGLRIDGPEDYTFIGNVTPGEKTSLSIPQGKIRVRASYSVVVPANGDTHDTMCSATTEPNETNGYVFSQGPVTRVFYTTAVDKTYTIDSDSSAIKVAFDAFKQANVHNVGLVLTQDGTTAAAQAKVYYLDPVSEKKLTDPCTNSAIYTLADSNGKVAARVPQLASDGTAKFLIEYNGAATLIKTTLTNDNPAKNILAIQLNSGTVKNAASATSDFDGDGIDDNNEATSKTSPVWAAQTLSVTAKSNLTSVKLGFSPTGYTYYCKLTDDTFRICIQNETVTLTTGNYTLETYAVDAEGLKIGANVSKTFRIYYPGDADLDFGTNGSTTTALSTDEDTGRGIKFLSNGKIVVGVDYTNASTMKGQTVVVRYDATGTLDSSFASQGVSTLECGGLSHGNSTAGLDENVDGSVIVACDLESAANSTTVYFYKLDSSGQRVTNGFGTAGWASVSLSAFGGTNRTVGQRVRVLSSGKFLASGLHEDTTNGNNNGQVFVARFNSDGTLDPTFGGVNACTASAGQSGVCVINVGFDITSNFDAFDVDSTGRIYIGGGTSSGDKNFWMTRLTADGSLDTTFNSTGIATIDFGSTQEYGHSLVADGTKVVFLGRSGASPSQVAMARLTDTGALDTSFGTSGKVLTSYAVSTEGRSLVRQSDGKYITVSRYEIAPQANYKIALARYLSNGQLDTSFGPDGSGTSVTISGYAAAAEYVSSLGKLFVTGIGLNASTDTMINSFIIE